MKPESLWIYTSTGFVPQNEPDLATCPQVNHWDWLAEQGWSTVSERLSKTLRVRVWHHSVTNRFLTGFELNDPFNTTLAFILSRNGLNLLLVTRDIVQPLFR